MRKEAPPASPLRAPARSGRRTQPGWRKVFCQELLSGVRLEERFAVVAAEQEGEAVQIAAELVKAVGGMTVVCLE